MALPRPRTPRLKSLTNSTRKSTSPLPNPGSRNELPILAVRCLRAHLLTSANSSWRKRRNGPRWSSSRARSRKDDGTATYSINPVPRNRRRLVARRGDRVDVYSPRTSFAAVHGFAPQRRARQSLQQGVGSGAATRQLQQYLSDPAAPAAFAKLIANPPLPCADYLALTKAQDHSWRFFSQSSKYLCATARSVSLAWASALVYM